MPETRHENATAAATAEDARPGAWRVPALPRLAAMAVAACLVGGCVMYNAPRPKPVTVPEVVQMSKAGVPADQIILQMQAAGMVYRLSASQLTDLAKEGVAPPVLDYMQQTYLQAVSRDAAYQEWSNWMTYDNRWWYGGAPFGWPFESVIIIQGRSGHEHREMRGHEGPRGQERR